MSETPILGPAPFKIPRMVWLRAAGKLLARQGAVELFGAPGYGLTLDGPRCEGLGAAPRDVRPADSTIGRAVLNGRFVLAGAVLEVGAGGDPWDQPSPTYAFAVELHRFSWLPHLLAQGEAGQRRALALTLGWWSLFGRWSPFAWSRGVLSRRVFHLACSARKLAAVADADQQALLVRMLARQTRHLLRLHQERGFALEDAAAAGVAGAALAGDAGARLYRRALKRLPKALDNTVLPDGCHASRSPEATLELLFDLLALDDALLQRGEPAPEDLTRALDRLTAALRVFAMADGRLACFQGGEAASAERVSAGRAHDDQDGEVSLSLPHGRYERLQGQLMQVIVDAGAPARGAWGVTACDQPLALEVVCGRDRLITNAGWSARSPERQGFRSIAAGSTLALGDGSPLEPLEGRLARILGTRLEGPLYRVEVRRHDSEGGALLELAHDGWSERFGLTHERRLYLDQRMDELRGEDRLFPTEGSRARTLAAPFCARFILHPEAQVSLARDRKSVLLRGPSSRGWWFRNDAADVAVEPGVHFENGVPQKTSQIVLRGVARTDGLTRLRWKITPAGGPDQPV